MGRPRKNKVEVSKSVKSPRKSLTTKLTERAYKLLVVAGKLESDLDDLGYGGVEHGMVDKIDEFRCALINAIQDGSFCPVVSRGRGDRKFEIGDQVQIKEKYSHDGAISLNPLVVKQVLGTGKDVSLVAEYEDEDGRTIILPRAKFERVK